MNAAQIAKLRRKVDTQVSAKVKKRDAEEQEKKDAIYRTLVLLQYEHPDRGAAVASYKGCPYCIVDGVLTNAGLLNNQDFELMEVSSKGTPDEVRYWFFKPEVYKAQTKLNDWMIKNWSSIRILKSQVDRTKGVEALTAMSQLGGIFAEFTSEFPNISIVEFMQTYHAVDQYLVDKLKNAKE